MKIYGFGPRFDVTITPSEGGEVYSAETPCQVEVPLPANLDPGVYTAKVNWGGRLLAVRAFRVIPWEEISVHPHPDEIADPSMPATAGLALLTVVTPGGTQDV